MLMGTLVNPCQSSFIPQRQSRDNIIVVQEIFHSMKKKKGKKGWMAIKLDLEKAYDRLSWSFIKDTLEDIGLPSDFVNLVWHCITSVRMRMLWNGEALEEFSPSRGIRQGDPTSPYIFVLCIEKLFQTIGLAVDQKIWNPIQLSRGGPKISHLAFADDVLLFAEAGVEQILLMKKILDLFCRASGQKVSEEKSRIFFSSNVNSNLKLQICDCSGFQVTNDLGKYLGVPIIHNRVNRRSFQFILDKVDQRLSNWKANSLSMAGRLTLTKSVIQSLPTYVMQSAFVPRYICDEIDKKCRSFVWGDSAVERKVHLVNWQKICSPKEWGGLGLRSARMINHTSLMKAGWHLTTRREDLWVKVVKAKYKCGSDLVPKISRERGGSNFWRGLCNSWKEVEENRCWRIGNGERVNCWFDSWVPSIGKLCDIVQRPLSDLEKNMQVCNLRSGGGVWDLTALVNIILDDILAKILALAAPDPDRGGDNIAWNLTTDGEFSNASAYISLLDNNLEGHCGLFKGIWKWRGPERFRIHLWKLSQEALVTNSWRQRRNLVESACCLICEREDESVLHVVRDCGAMRQVWNSLAEGDLPVQSFFNENIQSWIQLNLKSTKVRRGFEWSLVFGTAVLLAWQIKNERIFHQLRSSVNQMVDRILRQAKVIEQSFKDYAVLQSCAHKERSLDLRWIAPETGWFKLNCDGVVTNYGSKAGCGGVLRDEDGRFIFGFAGGLGSCSITQAELWAILNGSQKTKERGITKVIVESDSMAAVRLINMGCSSLHPSANLVFDIRKILDMEGHFSISHTYRETNQVADGLAKYGMNLELECEFFDSLPRFLSVAFSADCSGIVFPRGF